MRWSEESDSYSRERVGVHVGYITKVDGSGMRQKIKGRGVGATENENIETILPPGIASNPGSGEKQEAVFLDSRGDATHRYAFMVGDRKMHLQVGEGEAAIYSPANPDVQIKVDKDGNISLNGTTTTIQGDLIVTGDITSQGVITDSDGDGGA